MKIGIKVSNREEGKLVAQGLADAETFAFVKVIGALALLPSDRARRRVIGFVLDALNERTRAELAIMHDDLAAAAGERPEERGGNGQAAQADVPQ